MPKKKNRSLQLESLEPQVSITLLVPREMKELYDIESNHVSKKQILMRKNRISRSELMRQALEKFIQTDFINKSLS